MDIIDPNLLKIAIVGPESTGKSTMANFLAQEFHTSCVPEYARYYCKDLNNSYTLQDELNMFFGQLALEDAIIAFNKTNIIICDTTILTVKLWSDHLFGHTPANVLQEIKDRKYDFYLLMDINLPWENDPLRDFPNDRAHFMNTWISELEALNAPYAIVSNIDNERLQLGKQKCIDFIKNSYK